MERERKQMEQNYSLESERSNLSIDLAPENFPALPSPSSPNVSLSNLFPWYCLICPYCFIGSEIFLLPSEMTIKEGFGY